MPSLVKDLLACWEKRSEETSEFHIWNAIPLRLMWSLWMKQNSRKFKKVETSEPNLRFFFFFGISLFESRVYCFYDYLDLCNFRRYSFGGLLYGPSILEMYSFLIKFYHLS